VEKVLGSIPSYSIFARSCSICSVSDDLHDILLLSCVNGWMWSVALWIWEVVCRIGCGEVVCRYGWDLMKI
jgi:hypothetical protein